MAGPFFIGIVFIIIHLLANHILPTERLRRIRWFSFSGGLAVSYVFVYILPTLHTVQEDIEAPFAMESEIYFIGLVGVLMFFGSQLFVRQKAEYTIASFWLQISFYAMYNMMVAYIVLSSEVTGIQAIFYSFAIGMHFLAVAHDMWREFSDLYNKVGRYILAIGIVAGWLIALFIELPPLMQALITAFISGAMILNVFKYELPNDNESHFPTFASGVVLYTIVTTSLKFFFEW